MSYDTKRNNQKRGRRRTSLYIGWPTERKSSSCCWDSIIRRWKNSSSSSNSTTLFRNSADSRFSAFFLNPLLFAKDRSGPAKGSLLATGPFHTTARDATRVNIGGETLDVCTCTRVLNAYVDFLSFSVIRACVDGSLCARVCLSVCVPVCTLRRNLKNGMNATLTVLRCTHFYRVHWIVGGRAPKTTKRSAAAGECVAAHRTWYIHNNNWPLTQRTLDQTRESVNTCIPGFLLIQ